MSRTTQSPKRRPLPLAAGLLTLAGLALPLAASHAQGPSPERALLNSVSVAYRVVVADAEPTPIDGQRALLGSSAVTLGASSLANDSGKPTFVVDGERALLGRVAASSRRGITLAW